MPQAEGRAGRGGSFAEPMDPRNSIQQPRLFLTEKAAKIALNAWSKGQYYHHVSSGGWDREPEERTDIVPVAGRKKEDFIIKPANVSFWA